MRSIANARGGIPRAAIGPVRTAKDKTQKSINSGACQVLNQLSQTSCNSLHSSVLRTRKMPRRRWPLWLSHCSLRSVPGWFRWPSLDQESIWPIRNAAEISEDPQALASALQKLTMASRHVYEEPSPATASLFIVNPLHGGIAHLFSTHPPAEKNLNV